MPAKFSEAPADPAGQAQQLCSRGGVWRITPASPRSCLFQQPGTASMVGYPFLQRLLTRGVRRRESAGGLKQQVIDIAPDFPSQNHVGLARFLFHSVQRLLRRCSRFQRRPAADAVQPLIDAVQLFVDVSSRLPLPSSRLSMLSSCSSTPSNLALWSAAFPERASSLPSRFSIARSAQAVLPPITNWNSRCNGCRIPASSHKNSLFSLSLYIPWQRIFAMTK